MVMPSCSRPDQWIELLFSAKAVGDGGVVRRSVDWVEAEIGRATFVAAVRARGFHLLEAGGQFIVICNRAPMRRLV
ncbi:MAG: N-(5'-phosphoribosyl)anthranilate isomerase [Maritimibacter sp.]|nr:N-(5'-phosphoribosyl)anthranilate isomerase [Maritimibacter sp.]